MALCPVRLNRNTVGQGVTISQTLMWPCLKEQHSRDSCVFHIHMDLHICIFVHTELQSRNIDNTMWLVPEPYDESFLEPQKLYLEFKTISYFLTAIIIYGDQDNLQKK